MKICDFDYLLPEHLIAQGPAPNREESRLLVLRRNSKTWEHCRTFSSIAEVLIPGDVLVVNDTKVVPAKLVGRRDTGGRVEALIFEHDRTHAQALIRTTRRPKIGERYWFGEWEARVSGKTSMGWGLEFAEDVSNVLDERGFPPLPPYIKRKGEGQQEKDRERYQTVYAKHPGAIAAPTAGLHFTRSLLEKLERAGIEIRYVTLHVGVATFLPVRCENVQDHAMDKEYYCVPPETARAVTDARRTGRRIIAVGTTTCRTLETAGASGELKSGTGFSDLFIYPPFSFRIVDGIITNFHLPKSTLLLLISAFAGKELVFDVYQDAIRHGYRFYSYGDAMAIL